MTAPTPGERRALFYFGAVEAAARERASTAEIWAAIRSQAEAAGLSTAGVTIQDINRVRSQAAAIRNASERLAGGFGASPIEGSMIGRAPWARPEGEPNAIERWQARFEHTFLSDGVEQTAWRTVVFTGSLPGSVDEFRQAIFDDAAGMADAYGLEHVDVGSISLLRI